MTVNVAFYIPGMFDDEPQQEVLRQMIRHDFEIKVVRLPDLDFDRAILCDLVETARIVIEQIRELQSGKEIILIGFSFGSILAIEIAYQLLNADYSVNYLCLVDCRLDPDNKKRSLRSFTDLIFSHQGIRMLQRNVISRLKRIYKNRTKTSGSIHPKYRLAEYRRAAVRNWVPRQCEVKGTIIMSVFNYDRSRAVLSEKLPNCRLIKACCDHDHILVGTYLNWVADVLNKELSAFLKRSR